MASTLSPDRLFISWTRLPSVAACQRRHLAQQRWLIHSHAGLSKTYKDGGTSCCKVFSFVFWSWDLFFEMSNYHLGPPHVLWEVSFGFWVTWFVSSWQEKYQSVFFPKLQFLNDKLQLYPKKLFGTWPFGKIDVLVDLQAWKANSFFSFSGEK